jgi:hypothetical protein
MRATAIAPGLIGALLVAAGVVAATPLDGPWSGSADGVAGAGATCNPMRYELAIVGSDIHGLAIRFDPKDARKPIQYAITGTIGADAAVHLVVREFAKAEARLADGRITGFMQGADCRYEFAWTHDD